MGICSSNRTTRDHVEVVQPTTDDHAAIEAQYGDLLDPDNDNNLNLKYDYLYEMIPDVTEGISIKKTVGYKSRVTLEVIKKKRKEFWGMAGFS